MNLQDDLLSMFTARLEDRDGAVVIRVPEQEVDLGTLSVGESYNLAIQARRATAGQSTDRHTTSPAQERHAGPASEPPVTEGERLDVEIEATGEQGDGIARVGPGYVIFVSDTEVGERVTIEVTQTRGNFGFGEVVTPEPVTG